MSAGDWRTLAACVAGYSIAAFSNALLGDPLSKLGEYLRDRLGL
jgi:hypothetical protein